LPNQVSAEALEKASKEAMEAAREGMTKAIAGWKSAITPGFIKRYQNKKIFVKTFSDKGNYILIYSFIRSLTHSLNRRFDD